MGKATGPRTPRGKARASQNAVRHWIESGRILPEEQQEAVILRGGFTEDFKPQSLIEHEITEDLTLNRLIRRRIDIAFTREFRRHQSMQRSKSWTVTNVRLPSIGSGSQDWGNEYRSDREPAERLRPAGCIEALKGLQRRIRERGVEPQDLAVLRAAYGDQPTENAALAMYELISVAEKETEQGQDG